MTFKMPEPLKAVCVMVSHVGSTHMTPKDRYYTADQLRTAYNAGLEDGAARCEDLACSVPEGRPFRQAYRYAYDAIRALKEQP